MSNAFQFELPEFSSPSPSDRNQNFDAFIEQNKRIAIEAGFRWEMTLNANNQAIAGDVWDLRLMANDGRPGSLVLRSFGQCEDAIESMVARRLRESALTISPVSSNWQDLIKAHAIEHVLIRKKSLAYVSQAANAFRFLATVSQKAPWLVTAEDVRFTCEISNERQPSGGRTIVLLGLVNSLIDPLHLFNACPLGSLIARPEKQRAGRAKFAHKQSKQTKTLTERKNEEKLPERRAFWELIRIVFTEQPRTLNDALRFAMIKVLLITGLRVSEVALLPLDWRRTRSYVDDAGRPAGESGGISEALSIRHFAEKQDTQLLYEATQFVPEMFREELEATLDHVVQLTAPLRETLKVQYQTGRIFPMYQPDQLVDAVEMYTRLTGNPVWAAKPLVKQVQDRLDRYAETFDHVELADLHKLQVGAPELTPTISRYFSPERRGQGVSLLSSDGSPSPGRGVRGKFLRVSELEAYVRKHLPTKLSDLKPLTLDNGQIIAPWEMLFVMPKRAVGAGRGQTILDPALTFSVGVTDSDLLMVALGADASDDRSLFSIYGKTEGDKKLSIVSHSLRHLQNTELFRLGVADTIISKRFNRRSVAQSYEYDHRKLSEELDQMELPDEWEQLIGESKAATVAKMIAAGRANGPIVREFRKIQIAEGDAAALQFLAAEADGFHATPYGTCLNSFTVAPCPKHLECFAGCRHLSATNLPEHQQNIIVLHGRLKIAMEHVLARPDGSIGKANQLAHAKSRLDGVEALMTTLPGQPVFPTGPDLSAPQQRQSVLHGT